MPANCGTQGAQVSLYQTEKLKGVQKRGTEEGHDDRFSRAVL